MSFAHNPAYKLELIDLSDDTQVNSGGGTDTEPLQPPVGKIYEVCGLMIDIPDPVGSSANAHTLYVAFGNETDTKAYVVSASSNTGSAITHAGRYGFIATTVAPSAIANQFAEIHGLIATNALPVLFKYTNSTDANQTGTRMIKVLVRVYNEL